MSRQKRQAADRTSLICLCPSCRDDFGSAGNYRLRRVNYQQKIKDNCTYCQKRMGYDYYVIPVRKQR
ncbi:hypothetical protein DWZ50_00885 [Mediterraneibacter gnavus]|uniref:Uncharacterized protein n=1 Tax=Mediterraneibacter gnavus TaxID=33038 RepID=A0A415SDK6_MEDGN|nr:hypothetical protein DWZ50_00885 [Mediterraneibacter gnavus]